MIEPVLDADTRGAVDALRADGFGFVHGQTMRGLLERCGTLQDWDTFAESWNGLGPDPYLAQTGRRRLRRHGVYRAGEHGGINRAENQPHFQSSDYNRLQGDIERWFEPILPAVGDGATMRAVLRCCHGLFSQLAPAVKTWRIEVHQFRIEARKDVPGEPTPEGVHRDGVDYVLVLMVQRRNIASGTTTIHTAGGALLGSFTLTAALDAALVDDARVHHGVTPVSPLDPAQPAWRDVLVVTFRAGD